MKKKILAFLGMSIVLTLLLAGCTEPLGDNLYPSTSAATLKTAALPPATVDAKEVAKLFDFWDDSETTSTMKRAQTFGNITMKDGKSLELRVLGKESHFRNLLTAGVIKAPSNTTATLYGWKELTSPSESNLEFYFGPELMSEPTFYAESDSFFDTLGLFGVSVKGAVLAPPANSTNAAIQAWSEANKDVIGAVENIYDNSTKINASSDPSTLITYVLENGSPLTSGIALGQVGNSNDFIEGIADDSTDPTKKIYIDKRTVYIVVNYRYLYKEDIAALKLTIPAFDTTKTDGTLAVASCYWKDDNSALGGKTYIDNFEDWLDDKVVAADGTTGVEALPWRYLQVVVPAVITIDRTPAS